MHRLSLSRPLSAALSEIRRHWWAIPIVAIVLVVAAAYGHTHAKTLAEGALGAAALGSCAYLAWNTPPAWTITAGSMLAVFSGNWDTMGIPSLLSLDRLLLIAGIGGVLLRSPAAGRLPRMRISTVHWVMVAVIIYVLYSAFAVGTLFHRADISAILDRVGVIPYLTFLVAPVAFRHERDRRVLLGGFVVLGAYLGILAFLETVHANSLVFPHYINNPLIGSTVGRPRGPMLDGGQFGLALFVCAAASALAATKWRGRARAACIAVAVLCVAGVLFTLTRQAWVAAFAATVITMIAAPHLRRFAVPAMVGMFAVIAVLLVAVPGLYDRVQERKADQGTVWDRYALNNAAVRMIEAKPLFGFGWDRFLVENRSYFQQGSDYPLPARIETEGVHNLFLAYGVDLGLIGLTLWTLAMAMAVGSALLQRPPPGEENWRWLVLATFICFVGVALFAPTMSYSTFVVFLLAGVARSTRPDLVFDDVRLRSEWARARALRPVPQAQ